MAQSDRPFVRNGRRKPQNLYLQEGPEADDGDPSIGYVHDAALATAMVQTYNTALRALRGEALLLHPYVLGTSMRRSVRLEQVILCQVCFTHVPVSELHVDTDGRPEDVCRSCSALERP